MKVEIVVLNYNGRQFLKEFLPSIVEASKNSKNECRVTVLDKGSADGSIEFVKKNFSTVKLYSTKENKLLCSFNEYAEVTDADIMILLNSDIKVDKYFIDSNYERK